MLWEALRNRRFCNIKFRRQHPIGRYIVDFYAPSHRLVVEVDGSVHDDELVTQHDALRQANLVTLHDLKLIRLSAALITHDLATALTQIQRTLT